MANYTLDLTGQQVNAALNEVHNDKVIKNTAQTLTDAEKTQARTNIGAASTTDISNLQSNVATAYSASSTYAKGVLCIYMDQLYRANQDISTAEAWTAAHWTAISIADEFDIAVLVTEQSFTNAQQKQAQENLGITVDDEDEDELFTYDFTVEDGHLCLTFTTA